MGGLGLGVVASAVGVGVSVGAAVGVSVGVGVLVGVGVGVSVGVGDGVNVGTGVWVAVDVGGMIAIAGNWSSTGIDIWKERNRNCGAKNRINKATARMGKGSTHHAK